MATSGWPSAANTGVPAGITLTTVTSTTRLPAGVTLNSNGDLTISAPGVVLSGLDITGSVFINANNVTLINSRVALGPSANWVVVKIASGVTDTVIQNCTLDGMGSQTNGQANGIWGQGTFIANNIYNVENGITLDGNNSIIQDNYIHDLKASGSPHYDGIQIDGGISNVTIEHNTIINGYTQTSAVMIDNDAGPISNITVDNNLLVGGAYTIYVDGHFNSNSITGVSITNNHMGSGQAGIANFNRTSPVYTGNINDGTSIAASLPTGISDGDGNDPLTGGVGNDRLSGGAGNDLLNGGAGADTMRGRAGNDTYVVDNAGDTVIEVAGQGTDRVRSSVSFSLAGQSIENLTLTGSGNISGTGSQYGNTIIGNAGNNTINGGAGADTMIGGAGNDTYVVDNAGDRVIEAYGQGTDRVRSSVSFSLSGQSIQSVQNLTLTGSGNINGTGSRFSDTIIGNAGNNTINGRAGADHLTGGAGNDRLDGGIGADVMTGGGGSDTFAFTTPLVAGNFDTITDFSVAADTIRLSRAIFNTIVGTGTLSAAQFAANASGTAQDANDRIIYETDTGKLLFDRNGSAAGGATQFASVDPGLRPTNDDFVIV